MKQHITEVDLDQLTNKAKEKLLGWLVSKHYAILDTDNQWTFTTPSIGQMIEFLDEHNTDRAFDALCFDRGEYEWHVYHLEKPNNHRSVELCNALWSACVEILNKE